MLGLPESVTVCLFDLDGVLTDTASVHRKAWKQTFDPLLADHGQSEFTERDYIDFVDGKPRSDGVRDFLQSRGIDLPEGSPADQPEADTVVRGREPQECAAAQGDQDRRREGVRGRATVSGGG